MIDKTASLNTIFENLTAGHSIMVGGFGTPGTPMLLLDALLKKNVDNLTLIKNDANEIGIGISKVIEQGLATKFIVSHMGLNSKVIAMMNSGQLEVELFPQGILAEKIRAGGAGLLGIVTDIGVDTILRDNRTVVHCESGEGLFEPSLRADFALIHAAKADRAGNIIFAKSARNFNPLMATAANCVIVEAEEIVEIGELDPDQIHTPGAFIDHVVKIDKLLPEYGVMKHHVR